MKNKILIATLSLILFLSGCINTEQKDTSQVSLEPASNSAPKVLTVKDIIERGDTVVCQFNITSSEGQNITKISYNVYKSKDAAAIELLDNPDKPLENITFPAKILIITKNKSYIRFEREINGKFCNWVVVDSVEEQNQLDNINEDTPLNKLINKKISAPNGRSVEFTTYCKGYKGEDPFKPFGEVCEVNITKTD